MCALQSPESMNFRSSVNQVRALQIIYKPDVCTSDPMLTRCLYFRSYANQMFALQILCQLCQPDVCTAMLVQSMQCM